MGFLAYDIQGPEVAGISQNPSGPAARIVIQRRGSRGSKEFVDPGKKLLRAEGFGEEVVGSHSEGGFPVSILTFCGKDDNRQPFTMGLASDKFQDLKSRILGHHDVQEC